MGHLHRLARFIGLGHYVVMARLTSKDRLTAVARSFTMSHLFRLARFDMLDHFQVIAITRPIRILPAKTRWYVLTVPAHKLAGLVNLPAIAIVPRDETEIF